MPSGVPVIIVESGGVPVRPVEAGFPLMTVADNGMGTPITITDLGAPFIVQGYELPEEGLQEALSSDDGALLIDDDENLMETY